MGPKIKNNLIFFKKFYRNLSLDLRMSGIWIKMFLTRKLLIHTRRFWKSNLFGHERDRFCSITTVFCHSASALTIFIFSQISALNINQRNKRQLQQSTACRAQRRIKALETNLVIQNFLCGIIFTVFIKFSGKKFTCLPILFFEPSVVALEDAL